MATVQEIIDELKKYPPDMKVLVTGYEGGYQEEFDISQQHCAKSNLTDSYSGPFEIADEYNISYGHEEFVIIDRNCIGSQYS